MLVLQQATSCTGDHPLRARQGFSLQMTQVSHCVCLEPMLLSRRSMQRGDNCNTTQGKRQSTVVQSGCASNNKRPHQLRRRRLLRPSWRPLHRLLHRRQQHRSWLRWWRLPVSAHGRRRDLRVIHGTADVMRHSTKNLLPCSKPGDSWPQSVWRTSGRHVGQHAVPGTTSSAVAGPIA